MSTMTESEATVKPASPRQAQPDYVQEVAERAVSAGTRALLERWQSAEPDFEDWSEYAEWSAGHMSLVSHLYAMAECCRPSFTGQVMAAAYRALADAIRLSGSIDPATILDRLDALEAPSNRTPESQTQPEPREFPGVPDCDQWPF